MKLVKTLLNHGSDIGHTLSCLILEVRSSFVLRLSRTISCRPLICWSFILYLFFLFPFYPSSLRVSNIPHRCISVSVSRSWKLNYRLMNWHEDSRARRRPTAPSFSSLSFERGPQLTDNELDGNPRNLHVRIHRLRRRYGAWDTEISRIDSPLARSAKRAPYQSIALLIS